MRFPKQELKWFPKPGDFFILVKGMSEYKNMKGLFRADDDWRSHSTIRFINTDQELSYIIERWAYAGKVLVAPPTKLSKILYGLKE